LIVFDGDRKEFNVGYWHCDLGSIVPEAAKLNRAAGILSGLNHAGSLEQAVLELDFSAALAVNLASTRDHQEPIGQEPCHGPF
jgi:hypothetical protein